MVWLHFFIVLDPSELALLLHKTVFLNFPYPDPSKHIVTTSLLSITNSATFIIFHHQRPTGYFARSGVHLFRNLVRVGAMGPAATVSFRQRVHAPINFQAWYLFQTFFLIFCANSRILHPSFEISNKGTVIVYDKDLGKSLDKYIEYRALCSMHKWVVF